MELFTAIFTGIIIAATPLILAALGELVVEKSGVLNLGIEGMMLTGAAASFWCAIHGLPLIFCFVAGIVAGAALSLLFAVLSLSLQANQYAAGLALAIFGSGVSATLGAGFGAAPIVPLAPLSIFILSDIPVIGPLLFSYDILVYLAFVMVLLVNWWLKFTKSGLVVRTAGENPETSHAIGYDVIRIRYFAVLFGGAMSGLAGGYLSTAYTAIWVEDMTAGRGWIALALVVFAAWRPYRVLVGALLFGGMTIIQLHGQILGLPFPSELLSAAPYIATIVVLVMISHNRLRMRFDVPLSLAKPFSPTK